MLTRNNLFMYVFSYRQFGDTDWNMKEVDKDKNLYTVDNTDVYQKYEVKVRSVNDNGSAPDPGIVIGYSGEGGMSGIYKHVYRFLSLLIRALVVRDIYLYIHI